MALIIKILYFYIFDGGETDKTIDGRDGTDDDGENNHAPEPVFHADDFVHNIHVVEWDKGFPTFFSGFFENTPASDNEQNVENDKID